MATTPVTDSLLQIDEGADSSLQTDKGDSSFQTDNTAHSSFQTEEHAADNFSQSACRVIADSAEVVPTVDTLTTLSEESSTNVVEIDDLLIGKEHFTATMKKESHREGRYFQTDWFEKYECLRYHSQKRSTYCIDCINYGKSLDPSPFAYNNNAVGFRSWKKRLNKLIDHGDSRSHRNAEKVARHASSNDLPNNAQLNQE